MANITIRGNIGGEPELRFTPGGKAVLNFTVADNLSKRNASGEWENISTTWWRVQVWEKDAENLAETLSKGDRVIVEGTVHSRDWEDKDGAKRTSFDVTGRTVGIIPKGPGGAQRVTAPAGDPWATSAAAPF